MIDWAATIIALGAPLAGIGGGARFVWIRVERRIADIEDKLAKCEARDEGSQLRREAHLRVIEVLWAELDRIDPDSRALTRGKRLLDDLKLKTREAGAL